MKTIKDLSIGSVIRFNRPIEGTDYIIPGGYEMVMAGETFQFDFGWSSGEKGSSDPSSYFFHQWGIDFDEFPEVEQLTGEKLCQITEIKDFYVYTGEENESDLRVVSIESITFYLTSIDGSCEDYEVDENVLRAYNDTLLSRR